MILVFINIQLYQELKTIKFERDELKRSSKGSFAQVQSVRYFKGLMGK